MTETPYGASAAPDGLQERSEPAGEVHEHHRDAMQVGDNQQPDIDSAVSMPSATGDGEAVGESQPGTEQPSTINSMHSDYLSVGSTGDFAVMAGLTVSSAEMDETARSATIATPVFTRTSPETDALAPSFFAFGKASRQQLDMVGTRKGPTAAVKSLIVKTPESEVAAESKSHVVSLTQSAMMEDALTEHVGGLVDLVPEHATSPGQHDVVQAAQGEQQQPQPAEPGKKRRKKRKRRIIAPEEQPRGFATAVLAEGAQRQQQDLASDDRIENFAGQPYNSIEKVAHPDETEQIGTFEPTAEYLNPIRLSVPVSGAVTPPHSQRPRNQQATTFEHSQIIDLTIDCMEDGGEVFRNEDDATQREDVPVMVGADYAQDQAVGVLDTQANNITRPAYSRVHDRRALNRYLGGSRRSGAPVPVQRQLSELFSSDGINEAHQVLEKVQQKHEMLISKSETDRAALNAELQQITEAKQQLQATLDTVQQQNGDLSAVIEQQRSKVAAYEAKLYRFKTFVDGLGNDVSTLRKEAGVTRRKGEQLAREGEECKAEQAALFEQLSSCASESARLKNDALKAGQQAQYDLQAAILRNEYLEQQLGERIGLLAEERDRRAHLERQLVTVATSDEAVHLALKTNNDGVVIKLSGIYATLEALGSDKEPAKLAVKTMAAIQALNAQHSSNADDLSSIRDMVDIAILAQDADLIRDNEQSAQLSQQSMLAVAFKELKNDLDRREQLVQQDAAHREVVSGLQDKIGASNLRINELQAKLVSAEHRESSLRGAFVELQTKIGTLQSNPAPDGNGLSSLGELRAEVSAKTTELESANVELTAKTAEIRALSENNARLEAQSQSLQQKLEETKTQLVDLDVLRGYLELKFEAELKEHRKQLQEHSDRNVADHIMKVDNKLRLAATQKASVEKTVLSLQDCVAAGKARIEELRKHGAELAEHRDGELDQVKQQAQEWKHRSETIQRQLDTMQAAHGTDECSKKEYDAIFAELVLEKNMHHQASAERATFAKHMEELQQDLQSAQSEEANVKAILEKSQAESTIALEETRMKLVKAEEAVQRSETGVQDLAEQCKSGVAAAERKAKTQVEALQKLVTEAEAEVQRQKDEGLRFRAEVDEIWRNDEARHDQDLIAANRRATGAEAQQKETLGEIERLRKELESVVARHAEEQLRSQQRPSHGETAIRVPPAVSGVTPTMSNKENEPPKPRKKVDRNAQTIIESGRVPVPEILRKPDSKAKSAEHATRGPGVEEVQLKDSSATHMPARIVSDLTDDMLDRASTAYGHHFTQVVEETQFDDKLPSFAALNNRALSHALVSKPASAVSSLPSISNGFDHSSGSVNVDHHETPSQLQVKDLHSFAVYEDEQRSQATKISHAVQDQTHDSLRWPEAEKEQYISRKSYPVPNSASKMVHHDGERESYRKRSNIMLLSDQRPAAPRSESRASSGTSKRTPRMEPHSSTPDFVDNAASARKMSTYQVPSATAVNRRHSSNTGGLVADPRLAQRVAPPEAKRKAPPAIAEGYESERKKRKATEPETLHRNTESSRYSLRGAAQPSIRDLPSLEGSATGSRTNDYISSNSQVQTQTKSRMRKLGGGASRGVRRAKKMSKSKQSKSSLRFDAQLIQCLQVMSSMSASRRS
ncbi:hypothetical protein LTR87_003882 [Friedmanniomyces endolithicus]|nr:hypothetical protein LTR38_002719 [Friedmanniomyces endolithicus]KAK0882358.1 hypothetical protein LTR87_003882 [Friedmanniomyces endolithicus]